VQQLSQQAFGWGEEGGPSIDDDSSLVAAVLSKDRKATAQFVARFADGLYAYVRSRLAPRYDEVDDLVQEIFLAAWENLSRYQGSGPLQGWVMGIARHKVEDYYRARLRALEPIESSDEDRLASGVVPEFHRILEQDELKAKTRSVLASLPELYRLALIWRYWEQASAREMALKTDKTEKAIERLLARARAEFRERWNHGQSA
jgi:RNA polymerase sigma-70 factor (ECF subfamily)